MGKAESRTSLDDPRVKQSLEKANGNVLENEMLDQVNEKMGGG